MKWLISFCSLVLMIPLSKLVLQRNFVQIHVLTVGVLATINLVLLNLMAIGTWLLCFLSPLRLFGNRWNVVIEFVCSYLQIRLNLNMIFAIVIRKMWILLIRVLVFNFILCLIRKIFRRWWNRWLVSMSTNFI